MASYTFRDSSIALQALTHSSYSNESGASTQSVEIYPDNERLEFLGDAVIGLVVAEELMRRFPAASEGTLSRWRSSLVSRKTLADIALDLRLGDYLYLGRGEMRTGGAEKRSILAGAFESVVGAIYVDGGMDAAQKFLNRIYTTWMDALLNGDEKASRMLDNKTHLQEMTQSRFRTTPIYRLAEAWGLEHEKHFRVEIVIDGKVVADGRGRSKKEAEQHAASAAIQILGF